MSGNSVRVKFDASPLMDGLDKITQAAGDHVRAAAQAGAQVLYTEARGRAPVSEGAHFFYGTSFKKTGQRYLFAPGTLRDSIYQVYSVDNSSEGQRATYHVAWNHQKAPYGFMVEFGTSRAPAHPFLRPAFDAAEKTALAASKDTFEGRMAASLAQIK